MAFDLLFSPIKLGPLRLPNRLVMPAMTTNLAGDDGSITNRLIDFYTARARGGVGMVVVELSIVSVEGKRLPCNIGIWDDKYIEGLSRLAWAIRKAGAVAAIQIGHGGRESNSSYTGCRPVAPTDLPSIFRGTTSEMERPLELDLSGIKRLKSAFVRAAKRALEAGFQVVELHGCHGYLIAQFLSSCVNKRTDRYGGGSIENRGRFLVEIIEGIKNASGPEVPVVARINGNDYVPDGNTEAEAARIAFLAQKAGADAIHVSAGLHQSRPYQMIPGMDMGEACYTHLAQAVKAKVDIPVIAVGKIGRPELAEEILARQRADLIAMGRPLICDPQLPLKARQGRLEAIRRCIWCGQGCIGQIHHLKAITCLQNPTAGRESELMLIRTDSPKKVLVIGGGPAGLAAAAVSARIGHRVTLVEKGDELGGQLRLAHLPPTRESIRLAIENLTWELTEVGVEVIAGRKADLQMIEELQPDRIILAVGSRSSKPDIEGLGAVDVVFPEQALLAPERLGQHVAIIGGGLVGTEVADFLSARSHQVVIFEMLPELASKAVTSTKVYLTDQLAQQNVQVICRAQVVAVAPGKVSYIRDGWRFTVEEIDTILLAIGVTPEGGLARDLTRAGYNFELIGDCFTPGDAMSAIYQGYLAAAEIPIREAPQEGF